MGDPAQTFLKVTPSDLRAKAEQITGDWPTVPEDPVEPSKVWPSGQGLAQISATRAELAGVVQRGQEQAARLAACLKTAATAYEQVDAINKAALQGQPASVESVTLNPDLPPVTPPPVTPFPKSADTGDDGFPEDWQIAVGQFNDGDQGASLHTFAEQLNTLGNKLRDRGKAFDLGNTHWEGKAAEDAEAALRKHQSWLFDLAEQVDKFAEKARNFAQIHNTRKAEHPDQADIDEAAKYTADSGGLEAYFAKQQESDNARSGYVSDLGNSQHIFLDDPPEGAFASSPVKLDDVPNLPGKADEGGPGGNGKPGGGGGGGAPGGSQSPTGMPPSEPSVSPAGANSAAGQPQSGSPAGGGGSPSGGGGSPSGGGGSPSGAGGGLPGGLGGAPELPPLDDPSLSPAGLGGGSGGGGAGSGGGGGGGGIPSAPLGPATGAETVAASPAGARGAAGAGPAGAGGGMGGMGGGMGGMGHGGQGGAQGREKRRDPNLAPDEDLYVEDRAYTDPVIGHRPARRKNKAEGNDDS